MFIVRMIYASRVTPGFSDRDFNELLEAARRKNEKYGISGMLLFNADSFLQCLEGGRDQVNHIYNCILQDKRHFDPVILDYTEINQRSFEQWSMAYVANISMSRETLLRYTPNAVFEPLQMSGEGAAKMMLDLRETCGLPMAG